MKAITVSGLIMLAFASGAYAATMTAEQLKSELVGHPIHWKSKTQSGITTYKPDGTIEATVDGDKATYKGTWSIKDNKMCEKFGKEKCATINSLGGKKYSKGAGTFTVE
ncbi:hypothetical protein ELH80_33095 [Rhizobium ruizarguesonis]|uniref:DUF995 domain-containing protein n=1 Tax=Rhizobium ruizarguesonis TaxID=2081791 RepID=A0AAE8Q7E0_9HYPH|nr:hypothetical protein [Rhizobium ruizarguesonis]QND23040.1 hypothetical protein HB774_25550 [Rhizobium leguminosarum bv. viciae]MBC2808123.1 hypothetical protein [Rhizobium ruizarguesonis]MCB2404015.1 hypothetical protein [Rhizobium ruizarguesonis]NEI51533.1 hypothetical protein [Rhizobium ruizarguesonis]TAY70399.1 hypothetical protein ELH86_30360 [Rhizobium ruizarguesonis]